MTYKKDFVVAVRCGGRVLGEQGPEPTVFLPFGSEYSVILKNLHGTRAQVSVTIDGKDVLYGKSLIIDPGKKIELERFVKDLSKGKRFLFVEKTDEVIAKHGDEADDSIIHVEYRFERQRTSVVPVPYMVWPIWQPVRNVPSIYYSTSTGGDIGGAMGGGSMGNNINCCSAGEVKCGGNFFQAQSDVGKTVKGSSSNQTFTTTTVGALEDETHVINLVMRGVRLGQAVEEPETVKKKITCVCGATVKRKDNFCKKCGDPLNGKFL